MQKIVVTCRLGTFSINKLIENKKKTLYKSVMVAKKVHQRQRPWDHAKQMGGGQKVEIICLG
jgi:hypothetical protein